MISKLLAVVSVVSVASQLTGTRVIPFSGTILNTNGFDLELLPNTNCTVSFSSLPYAVNCNLLFGFMKSGKSSFDFNVGLYGGVSLNIDPTTNSFVETVSYQASLPVNPSVTTSLTGVSVKLSNINVPSTIGTFSWSQQIPQVCADKVLELIPQTSFAGTIIAETGSDACLGLQYNSTGASNGGASIALVLNMYILDQNKMSPGAKTAFGIADKVVTIPSLSYSFNIGKLIVNLLRQQGVNVPAIIGGRRRYLAASDPSSGVVDANGNFLVGNAATNWPLIIGCSVGAAVLVVAIGAVVVIRRRGGLKFGGLGSAKKWAPVKENKKLNTQMSRPGLTKV